MSEELFAWGPAPEVVEALRRLAGRIDESTMQKLNWAVDAEGRTPAAVAAAYLEELALETEAAGRPEEGGVEAVEE